MTIYEPTPTLTMQETKWSIVSLFFLIYYLCVHSREKAFITVLCFVLSGLVVVPLKYLKYWNQGIPGCVFYGRCYRLLNSALKLKILYKSLFQNGIKIHTSISNMSFWSTSHDTADYLKYREAVSICHLVLGLWAEPVCQPTETESDTERS